MCQQASQFENLVSYERCKAASWQVPSAHPFENLVSYERCKATRDMLGLDTPFENLVSYERCVVKPVNVQAGKIAPWFGEKGGGIQYEFSQKISELLEQGILRKVEN